MDLLPADALGWREVRANVSGLICLGLHVAKAEAGLIYLVFGRVEPQVWLALFVLVMMVELPLHLLFAHFWNRRAKRLAPS